jgi:hypothetical protein
MKMILDKIKQKYQQFQMELDRIDRCIEMNRDQWKRSLGNRLETRVSSVLTKQLQQHNIDGLEVNQAKEELIRVQKLCDLLNSQTIISVASVEDDQFDVNKPNPIFPSIIVDALNSIDQFSTENNSETMEYSDQHQINRDENTICRTKDGEHASY